MQNLGNVILYLHLNKQLALLKRHPRVEKVKKLKHRSFSSKASQVELRGIEIVTNDVYLYTPSRRKKGYLGKFKILICLHTTKLAESKVYSIPYIRYENLTNPKPLMRKLTSTRFEVVDDSTDEFAHPHCKQGGTPCFKDYYPAIAKLFDLTKKKADYLAVLELCFLFLETYTADDEYTPHELWFK